MSIVSLQSGISERPQVWDGEGVDPTDFNNLSHWSRAYLNDLVLGALMRRQYSHVGPQGSASGGPQLYSLGGSGAPRNHTSTARSFRCNPGPLFYTPNAPTIDGQTPKVCMYYLAQDEITGQLAAGDATNPRVDVVYVRITDIDGPLATRDFKDATSAITSQSLLTTKQTKLEWQIVQGTPAVHPGIPAAPDSTWAKWGAWWVPAAMGASLFGSQHIFDYRIPMEGYKRHIVPSHLMGGNVWTINVVNGYASSTAGGGFSAGLYAYLPRASGRVMGYSFDYIAADAGSFQGIYVRSPSAGSIITYPPNFSPSGVETGASFADLNNYVIQGGEWLDPSSGLPTATSASGWPLFPLWATGYGTDQEFPAATDRQDGGTVYDSQLVSAVWAPNAAGDKIICCSFDVAGG